MRHSALGTQLPWPRPTSRQALPSGCSSVRPGAGRGDDGNHGDVALKKQGDRHRFQRFPGAIEVVEEQDMLIGETLVRTENASSSSLRRRRLSVIPSTAGSLGLEQVVVGSRQAQQHADRGEATFPPAGMNAAIPMAARPGGLDVPELGPAADEFSDRPGDGLDLRQVVAVFQFVYRFPDLGPLRVEGGMDETVRTSAVLRTVCWSSAQPCVQLPRSGLVFISIFSGQGHDNGMGEK